MSALRALANKSNSGPPLTNLKKKKLSIKFHKIKLINQDKDKLIPLYILIYIIFNRH